jgi:GntR family transcriptional regulator, galactonate operon transcriptional repressor
MAFDAARHPSAAQRAPAKTRLYEDISRILALRIMEAERRDELVAFPNEAELCTQLGVSRTVVREAMKVLADKGLVEMRPRTGTRARPRSEWRLLDPDILAWQVEVTPDVRFLRDLSEVRLAIEPTAAGFAAVRATPEELDAIATCVRRGEALAHDHRIDAVIDAELQLHAAVVAASHNPLLQQLNGVITLPFRTSLLVTLRSPVDLALVTKAHRELLASLRRRDPVAARSSAEKAVGVFMIAVEEVVRAGTTRANRKGS